MSTQRVAPLLNGNHRRRLLATFRHVDGLLGDAAACIEPTGDGSPFRSTIPDATPSQRRAVSECRERLREAMCRFLDRQGIPIEPPTVSGLWSFRVALEFASVDLEEIEPHRLASYGALSADAQVVVGRMVAELQAILSELSGCLEKIASGGKEPTQSRRT